MPRFSYTSKPDYMPRADGVSKVRQLTSSVVHAFHSEPGAVAMKPGAKISCARCRRLL